MRHVRLWFPSARCRAALVILFLAALLVAPAAAWSASHHPAACARVHSVPIVIPPLPPVGALVLSVPTLPAAATHDRARPRRGSCWNSDDADGFGWAVIGGESDCMDGMMDDDAHNRLAREARASGSPVLWLRVDGREWVVRDRALVERAEEIQRPLRELGGRMGRMGGEMGQLGGQMGRHGAETGRLAARRAVLEVRLATDELRDEDDRLSKHERDELQRRADELQREQDRREAFHDRAAMRDVEQRMHELDRRLEVMGRRMKELSRRARVDMQALAREAISTRKAARFGGAA